MSSPASTSRTHTPHSGMSTSPTPTSPALASTRIGQSYDAYPIHIPRELAPGILDDGTISANHPLVKQYLDYTARKFLHAEALATTTGKHTKPSWHKAHKHPAVTWWRVEHGGVAHLGDVHAVLGPGATDRLARAIFALAALSVFAHWKHPAHWAFWAKFAREKTAALVHPVVRAVPKQIYVPDEVGWVDEKMAMYALGSWHGNWFLIDVNPKRYILHPDKEPKEKATKGGSKNANGKRTLLEDGQAVPPKKRRTQDTTEPGPPRRSARTRKDMEVEPAPDPTPDTTSTSPLNAVAQVANEPEDVVVDVESIESGAVVEAGSEGQAQEAPAVMAEGCEAPAAMAEGCEAPAAQSAKKSRSTRTRAKRSTMWTKRKGARKPRVPSGQGDAPSELMPPPAPPSSSAPCIIRIAVQSALASTSPSPATGEVMDKVPAAPASGETTAGASREGTAVDMPCSGLSTRVGTPLPEFEAKVEAIVAHVKLVREIPAPVRSSARIRAKSLKLAGVPQPQ